VPPKNSGWLPHLPANSALAAGNSCERASRRRNFCAPGSLPLLIPSDGKGCRYPTCNALWIVRLPMLAALHRKLSRALLPASAGTAEIRLRPGYPCQYPWILGALDCLFNNPRRRSGSGSSLPQDTYVFDRERHFLLLREHSYGVIFPWAACSHGRSVHRAARGRSRRTNPLHRVPLRCAATYAVGKKLDSHRLRVEVMEID